MPMTEEQEKTIKRCEELIKQYFKSKAEKEYI